MTAIMYVYSGDSCSYMHVAYEAKFIALATVVKLKPILLAFICVHNSASPTYMYIFLPSPLDVQ